MGDSELISLISQPVVHGLIFFVSQKDTERVIKIRDTVKTSLRYFRARRFKAVML